MELNFCQSHQVIPIVFFCNVPWISCLHKSADRNILENYECHHSKAFSDNTKFMILAFFNEEEQFMEVGWTCSPKHCVTCCLLRSGWTASSWLYIMNTSLCCLQIALVVAQALE